MWLDVDYGTRLTATVGNPYSGVYHLAVQIAEYGGVSAEVRVTSAGLAWGVAGGAGTPADVLLPIGASRCDLSFVDPTGVGGNLAGLSDGAVRLQVRRANASGALLWQGYLLPETYDELPWLGINNVAGMTFADPWFVLSQRPFAGDDSSPTTGRAPFAAGGNRETLLTSLARCLEQAGGAITTVSGGVTSDTWTGITTAMDWRPYLADDPGDGSVHVAAATDPLFALNHYEDAWLDEDGASTTDQAAAVRRIAARLGLRLFQSPTNTAGTERAAWVAVQRDLLADDPEAVPVFDYLTLTSGYDLKEDTVGSADLVVDTEGWDVYVGARRQRQRPVRQVESNYEFQPTVESLVYNGSFEYDGDGELRGSASGAEYWTLDTGAERRAGAVGDLTFADRYVLEIPSYVDDTADGGPNLAGAVQEDLAFVSANPLQALNLSLDYRWTARQGWVLLLPTLYVSVGPAPDGTTNYVLFSNTVTSLQDTLEGQRAAVPIAPFLDGVSGAVEGTPITPAGSDIVWQPSGGAQAPEEEVTMTLAEDVKVGDTLIVGRIAGGASVYGGDGEGIPSGYEAKLGYYNAAVGTNFADIVPEWVGYSALAVPSTETLVSSRNRSAYAVTPSGESVSGFLRIEFQGGQDYATEGGGGTGGHPDTANPSTLYVDDITVGVEVQGRPVSSYGYTAALPAGEPGDIAQIPVRTQGGHPLGDGPLPDVSDTRLMVEGEDAVLYETQQGGDTGWKRGAFSGGDASTETPLDQLSARTALRQIALDDASAAGYRAPERWRGTLVPPSGSMLWPLNVPRLYSRTYLHTYAAAGESVVLVQHRVPLGSKVVFSPGTAREETHYVGAVSGGSGAWSLTLTASDLTTSATLANSHYKGTNGPVNYGFLAWWDSYRLDLARGTIDYDATELALSAGTDFVETLNQGA